MELMDINTSVEEVSSNDVNIENALPSYKGVRNEDSQKNRDFLAFKTHKITFKNITFTATNNFGKPTKTLLKNISGEIKTHDVIAVMGPSGAGKSTLLKVLTLQAKKGYCEGSCRVDGADWNITAVQDHCAVMGQNDMHWDCLSVKEHISFATASFYYHHSKEENERKIDEILKLLGLSEAVNTLASQLSGGEKRRLSLALALTKSPAFIFLDEPVIYYKFNYFKISSLVTLSILSTSIRLPV